MINVAIMEGWAGGKWHTKAFTAALQASGYAVTDILHAEVIIAHSIACYSLPTKTPANIFMLIDPPYWPAKSIISRFLEKPRQHNHVQGQTQGWKNLIKKVFWGIVYIVAKPSYTILALKSSGQIDFLNNLSDKNVLIIRNQQDYFCSPDIQVAITTYPNVRYIVIPGEHDDYYSNPRPYIDLLPKAI